MLVALILLNATIKVRLAPTGQHGKFGATEAGGRDALGGGGNVGRSYRTATTRALACILLTGRLTKLSSPDAARALTTLELRSPHAP